MIICFNYKTFFLNKGIVFSLLYWDFESLGVFRKTNILHPISAYEFLFETQCHVFFLFHDLTIMNMGALAALMTVSNIKF